MATTCFCVPKAHNPFPSQPNMSEFIVTRRPGLSAVSDLLLLFFPSLEPCGNNGSAYTQFVSFRYVSHA